MNLSKNAVTYEKIHVRRHKLFEDGDNAHKLRMGSRSRRDCYDQQNRMKILTKQLEEKLIKSAEAKYDLEELKPKPLRRTFKNKSHHHHHNEFRIKKSKSCSSLDSNSRNFNYFGRKIESNGDFLNQDDSLIEYSLSDESISSTENNLSQTSTSEEVGDDYSGEKRAVQTHNLDEIEESDDESKDSLLSERSERSNEFCDEEEENVDLVNEETVTDEIFNEEGNYFEEISKSTQDFIEDTDNNSQSEEILKEDSDSDHESERSLKDEINCLKDFFKLYEPFKRKFKNDERKEKIFFQQQLEFIKRFNRIIDENKSSYNINEEEDKILTRFTDFLIKLSLSGILTKISAYSSMEATLNILNNSKTKFNKDKISLPLSKRLEIEAMKVEKNRMLKHNIEVERQKKLLPLNKGFLENNRVVGVIYEEDENEGNEKNVVPKVMPRKYVMSQSSFSSLNTNDLLERRSDIEEKNFEKSEPLCNLESMYASQSNPEIIYETAIPPFPKKSKSTELSVSLICNENDKRNPYEIIPGVSRINLRELERNHGVKVIISKQTILESNKNVQNDSNNDFQNRLIKRNNLNDCIKRDRELFNNENVEMYSEKYRIYRERLERTYQQELVEREEAEMRKRQLEYIERMKPPCKIDPLPNRPKPKMCTSLKVDCKENMCKFRKILKEKPNFSKGKLNLT